MDIFIAPKKEKIDPPGEKPVISPHQDLSQVKFLSSFCHNPQGIRFQTQKQHESIILFLRSHFVTNLTWIVISIFLIILPIIAAVFSSIFNINFLSSPVADKFTKVYVLFYYLIIFSYVFISFLHWFYNVFIITTERVVDIDYSDIVIHNIAVASLSHVQDVNYTQSGFIPTFFNYGHLFVQTAGNETNFEAISIPKPREATHIIGDLTGKGTK